MHALSRREDYALLSAVQLFFGGIGVLKIVRDVVYFDINSVADLGILFKHLSLYPLLSTKRNMFYIFSMIHNIYVNKLHLTVDGFLLCISYINILNRPINPTVLQAIVAKHGSLPSLILSPVLVVTHYTLNPY